MKKSRLVEDAIQVHLDTLDAVPALFLSIASIRKPLTQRQQESPVDLAAVARPD